MKIRRYNPNTALKSQKVFYIQSHGLNAGRPLKNPIPNSWEVQTETANAFEICFVIFNSKILELYIRGSVIPFIALHEYKKIILPYLTNPIKNEMIFKKLDAVQKITLALEELEQKKILYKQLKTAISSEILKTLKAT